MASSLNIVIYYLFNKKHYSNSLQENLSKLWESSNNYQKSNLTSKYSSSVISLYDGTSRFCFRAANILSKLRPVIFFNIFWTLSLSKGGMFWLLSGDSWLQNVLKSSHLAGNLKTGRHLHVAAILFFINSCWPLLIDCCCYVFSRGRRGRRGRVTDELSENILKSLRTLLRKQI